MYWLCARIRLPYLYNTHGTGTNTTEMNPNKLLAHPVPKDENSCTVNRGKAPPKAYLNNCWH